MSESDDRERLKDLLVRLPQKAETLTIHVTLTKPGWKPELAKRVKQQLLADGHAKIDTTVLDRWQKLFEALQEARVKADAVVTV